MRRTRLTRWPSFRRPPDWPTPLLHVVAVGTTLAFFGLQSALGPLFHLMPFGFLFLSVIAVAWMGGRGPGLLSTALSALLADYFFLTPARHWSFTLRDIALVGLFLAAGSIVSLLCGALRDAFHGADLAGQDLQDQIELNQSIIRNAADAIFVTDASQRVVFANPEAKALLGVSAEEMAGRPLHDLVHRRDPNGWLCRPGECQLQAILQTGGAFRGLETEALRKNGTTASVSCSSGPRELRGAPTGAILIIRDVSDKKEAERVLREADRHKDAFLAMLSHELRNPLAPIRNSLYVLDRVPPNGEPARRAKQIIDRQVAHITRLVDDLLDVTRIARNKVQLKSEPLDLGELIHRTVEDHRHLFTDAGIQLTIAVCQEPVWVMGDSDRLSQALGNLLQNAVKFTLRKGTTTVSLARAETGDAAVIRVSDTGVGIAPEQLPRLFEPFAQADSAVDRSRGGLGLGLALVKGLVEVHNGKVTVQSAGIGAGAEFTIQLPVIDPPEHTTPPEVEPDRPEKRRVLIIEDNLDAAESLRQVLEQLEHRVDVAYDGPDGIRKARSFRPDVVLCDIGLPGMTGYDVARAIRSDDVLNAIRLVALTGYALPDDVGKAREAGFNMHIAKPATPEQLEQAIEPGRPATRDQRPS